MKTHLKLKEIMHLAWPAIIQEAMATVVAYVDTAMVGLLGASASAAVGLTGTVSWLTSSICIGLGIGVLSISAQAKGANDHELCQKAGQQALFLTLFIGTLIGGVCYIISPYLPLWLNADPTIVDAASLYFKITTIPYIFRAAIMIFSCALRGVSDMKTPMYINIFTNILNIILNFLLIYPTNDYLGFTMWGAGLGTTGAALATAISFIIGGLMMFERYFHTPAFNFKYTGIHFDFEVMKKCLRIGLPVSMERSVICMGYVACTGLIAKLGVIPFAAHTIAIQAEQAFYIPGYGFQSACATLVGNGIGSKDERKVKETTYLISLIAFITMAIAGVILFIFAESLMSFFTKDLAVISLGAKVLRIVALSEPIYGVMVILEGTFNGMGDAKAPFIYSIITMWCIRVFFTYLAIHFSSFGLEVIWIIMVIDNVTRCALLSRRFLKGKWKYLIQEA